MGRLREMVRLRERVEVCWVWIGIDEFTVDLFPFPLDDFISWCMVVLCLHRILAYRVNLV